MSVLVGVIAHEEVKRGRKEWYRACINSVLEQTFKADTLFLPTRTDDGTVEFTKEIVGKKAIVTVIPVDHTEVSVSNIILSAPHKYTAIMHSDDEWHRDKLKIQYAFMEAHPEIRLCMTMCYVHFPEKIEEMLVPPYRYEYWNPSSWMIRKGDFRFQKNSEHWLATDVDFVDSVLNAGEKIAVLHDYLTVLMIHENANSVKNAAERPGFNEERDEMLKNYIRYAEVNDECTIRWRKHK